MRVLYMETLGDEVEILSPLHTATLSQCDHRSNCASCGLDAGQSSLSLTRHVQSAYCSDGS